VVIAPFIAMMTANFLPPAVGVVAIPIVSHRL
jgi:hypothetical protein